MESPRARKSVSRGGGLVKMIFGVLLSVMMLWKGVSFAQEPYRVIGRCLDSVSGRPVPFAHVVYDSDGHGVACDIDGRFEVKAAQPVEWLELHCLGYRVRSIPITQPEQSGELVVRLTPAPVQIGDVVIQPRESPALRIVRGTIARRGRYSPDMQPGYSFIAYSKLTLSGEEKMEDFRLDAPPALGGQLLVSETVVKHRYAGGRHCDSIMVARTSGLKNRALPLRPSSFQSLNFLADEVHVLGARYVSPLSERGLRIYRFHMQDTVVSLQGDTIYTIAFSPRRAFSTIGLMGALYISARDFAPRVAMAWGRGDEEIATYGFEVRQQYNAYGDSVWFADGLRCVVSMPDSALRIDVETHLRDVQLGREAKLPTWDIADMAETGANPMSDSLLRNYRAAPLTRADTATYRIVDSLGQKAGIDRMVGLLSPLQDGLLPLGPLQVDLAQLLDFNSAEGVRVGLGVGSNTRRFQRVQVGGYGAYGFRDRHWKYGGHVNLKLHGASESYLKLGYSHDLARLGESSLHKPGHELLMEIYMNRVDYTSAVSATLGGRIHGRLQYWLEGRWDNVFNTSGLGYSTLLPTGFLQGDRNDYQLIRGTAVVRWAPRSYLQLDGRGISELRPGDFSLELGFEVGAMLRHLAERYYRLQGQLTHTASWLERGKLHSRLGWGFAVGHYPLARGFFSQGGGGSWISIMAFHAFATAPWGYYYHDAQAEGHWLYDARPWLALPVSKNWRPGLAIAANAGWGLQWHRVMRADGHRYPSMQKGFYEVGMGIVGLLGEILSGGESCLLCYYRVGPYMSGDWKQNITLVFTLAKTLD